MTSPLQTLAAVAALFAAAALQAAPRTLSCGTPQPATQALYDYLAGLQGKAILSGQQEVPHKGVVDSDEIKYVKQQTGRFPAILGLDYIDYEDVSARALDWWKRGGIPSICWHWGAPTTGSGFEATKGRIDLEQALTPGTTLHKALLEDLDRTATELKSLQKAGVPVLWRPLHELNGDWFWWGKGSPEQFKRLWILMHERYTKVHQLNNLIWVLGFTSKPDAAWYPGDGYVDIAGADNYAPGPQKGMYLATRAIAPTGMPIAYHECGPIPDPRDLLAEKVEWVWFLTWHTIHIKEQNSPDYLRQVYEHPLVITLDEVPSLGR